MSTSTDVPATASIGTQTDNTGPSDSSQIKSVIPIVPTDLLSQLLHDNLDYFTEEHP